LFSFDGLTSNTWFCVRLIYRLFYRTPEGLSEISTKQELIARTKNNSQLAHSIIDDQIILIYDAVSDVHSVNVTVGTVFASRPKMVTLVVPELKCDRTSIKPHAKLIGQADVIHFDVKKALLSSNIAHAKQFSEQKCAQLCIFPFLRAEILNVGQETFRGKEWCGTLQEASKARTSNNANNLTTNVIVLFIYVNFLLIIVLLHQ
uniref:Uncharacterized protein n=1 Tax=Acrobeloides nanus TaxID=290746 RepID=A0A914CJ79_9BILA